MPPEALPSAASASSPPAAADLSQRVFDEIRALAREVFGLDLKQGKEMLVSARLGKRVRELGLQDIQAYLAYVRDDRSGQELSALIDALTTNFTSFMREAQHFALLSERILPTLAARRQVFTIWSAGCSTGEEPYSILFQCAEALGESRLGSLRLLATDISTRVLDAAQSGVFAAEKLKDLPESWHRRFFQRGEGASAGKVRVRPEWRQRVSFSRLNLMQDFSRLPLCAVIFCRNVMIYFDKPTQEKLVRRFAAQLEPGGWLFIGHSEGLLGMRHGLDYCLPAVYRKPGRAAGPAGRSAS
ncbi:MAG: protein-glutamate O-methyltransferase CheR [Acidobacteria bacterium]|nr:protein-glutamate O-methyltransferase CheR [Acidobacteriota bacterium]